MHETTATDAPAHLHGILRWEDLDRLWQRVKDSTQASWFLYREGAGTADTPASASEVAAFVAEVDAILRREHREDYCGVVYTDDPAQPTYIKIYHPRGMGSSCALPGHGTRPAWILSRRGPVPASPAPRARPGWLARLLGRG